MGKNYLLLLFLFLAGTAFAQEELSKEEKARREKNIEAGNPFKQFGYKAKVATLSKGKYLEVHDLDSIVTIGSVRFHVDRKEIVGLVERDSSNGMYARPIGDMPSRWLSPDPLAEEFTSWSPYNFVYNSPLKYSDPTGMAPEWKPGLDGNLVAEKGDNTKTLAKYLGTTTADVSKRFTQNGKNISENRQFKEGEKVNLNNNMSRAIKNSEGVSPLEKLNGSTKSIEPKTDNYICDQCAQMAVNGEEITPANAEKYNQFTSQTAGFSEVSNFDNVPFGQGIAIIGGQHVVTNYGQSKDGTQYVFSKDGRFYKPQVYSLQQSIDLFNQNQGTKFTTSDVKYYKKDAKSN